MNMIIINKGDSTMEKGDTVTFGDREYECWTELTTGWLLIRPVDDIKQEERSGFRQHCPVCGNIQNQ